MAGASMSVVERFNAQFPGAVAEYVEGASLKSIARTLAINPARLRRVLRIAGVLRPYVSTSRARLWHPDAKVRRAKREAAVALTVAEYVGGKSMLMIAREFDLSKKWVAEVVKRAGVSRPAPGEFTHQMSSPELLPLVGKVHDIILAELLGCHRSTVTLFRSVRGIPAVPKVMQPPIRIYSIDAARPLGGSYHDVHKDGAWSDWLEEMGATVW